MARPGTSSWTGPRTCAPVRAGRHVLAGRGAGRVGGGRRGAGEPARRRGLRAWHDARGPSATRWPASSTSRRLPEGSPGAASWSGRSARSSARPSSASTCSAWPRARSRRGRRPTRWPRRRRGRPLARRERVREADRRGFLGALAAADGGRVTLSYARSDGAARAMYPSRWLLEVVSQRGGHDRLRLGAAAPARRSGGPGCCGSPPPTTACCAVGGRRRCRPPTWPTCRLASVVAWRTRHGATCAITRWPQRAELPLGAALRAARARRSAAFTAYDGNLAELAGSSRLMVARLRAGGTSRRPASSAGRPATSSTCFRTCCGSRRPAAPRTSGRSRRSSAASVVHEILEPFFRELHDGRAASAPATASPRPTTRGSTRSRPSVFAGSRRQGRTGHPLAWENARAAILADLHALLEQDQAWREPRAGAGPLRAAVRPPDDAELVAGRDADPRRRPDGRRSAAHRPDRRRRRAPRRRALIIDYKTGGVGLVRRHRRGPALGGRHLQLALYAQALLRASLDDEPSRWDVAAEFRFVTARGGSSASRSRRPRRSTRGLAQVLQWVADGVGAGVFLPVPGDARPGSVRELPLLRLRPGLRGHPRRGLGAQAATTWRRRYGRRSASRQAHDRSMPTDRDAPPAPTSTGRSSSRPAPGPARRPSWSGGSSTWSPPAGSRWSGLAAITFTEAAAAELRDRVREGLEKAAADAEPTPTTSGSAASRPSSEIDLAAIQTIHAFAGGLLRTLPARGRAAAGLRHARRDRAGRRRSRSASATGSGAPRSSRAGRETIRRALLLGLTQSTCASWPRRWRTSTTC